MNKTAIAHMNSQYRPMRTSTELSGNAIQTRRVSAATDLQPYVMEFWEYSVDPTLDYAPVQVFPNACLSIRFNIKPDGVEAILYGPSVLNNMKGLFYSDWVIFGAALWPARSYQLLGLPVHEIRDLRIHLDCIWPQQSMLLCEQIEAAADMHARISVLSTFLRAIMRDKPPQADFLNAYSTLVSKTSLAPDIRLLTDASGTSGRSLRRHFKKYLGLGPKQMHQLIKVQHALKLLRQGTDRNLADLSIQLGFSDQAHFNRCFKAFVGITPSRFMRLVGHMQDKSLDIWQGLDPQYKDRPSPEVFRFQRDGS